jgi:hypothetical protein
MPYSILVLPCAPRVGSILAVPTASSVDRPAKRGRRSKCRYRRCHVVNKNPSNGTSSVSTGSHQLWVRSPTFLVPVPSRGATLHSARHPQTMGQCMAGKVGTSNSHVFRQALRNTSRLSILTKPAYVGCVDVIPLLVMASSHPKTVPSS